MFGLSSLSGKCLDDFLSKEPYSKLRKVARYNIFDLLRALNWAAAKEIMEAFYELGLDKTLKRPRSTMEVCYEHYIVDTLLLREILDSLVYMGILDEAAGRYKIRYFKRKIKKPAVVDEFMKTPLRAVFEVIRLMGESIVDVLLTGNRELDWVKDAAIAFEPFEFSPQMASIRLKACDMFYRYIREVMSVERKEKLYLLMTGLGSGFGVVNVAQFFTRLGVQIIALDPSEREIRLAEGLLEDFGLEIPIGQYDILRDFSKSSLVMDTLPSDARFDGCIAYERWRFYDRIGRAQILTNIAYSLNVSGSLLDLSLPKEQILLLNTVLYTIRGWRGHMSVEEKRNFMCMSFQRVKEYTKKIITRADLPLVRGIWL